MPTPAGQLPPSDRFFARIKSIDLECPACGMIAVCSGRTGPYNARTGHFVCDSCSKTFYLGIIAWPSSRAPGPHVPPNDWMPTPAQARAMSQYVLGRLPPDTPTTRKNWTAPRNIKALPPGCRCELTSIALIVHPACPVHSVTGRPGSDHGGPSRPPGGSEHR